MRGRLLTYLRRPDTFAFATRGEARIVIAVVSAANSVLHRAKRTVLQVPDSQRLDTSGAWVQNAWRRIRGAIGMGLTWGAVWAGAGLLIARVPGVDVDVPLGLLLAPLGFASGIIFAGLLVAIEGRRRFGSMSLPRFAAWGAMSGIGLGGILVVGAMLRGENLGVIALAAVPGLALVNAACAAGLLAAARRAERRELADSSADLLEVEARTGARGEDVGQSE